MVGTSRCRPKERREDDRPTATAEAATIDNGPFPATSTFGAPRGFDPSRAAEPATIESETVECEPTVTRSLHAGPLPDERRYRPEAGFVS